MFEEKAACDSLHAYLERLGHELDRYLQFEHKDAMHQPGRWQDPLTRPLPTRGIGIDGVIEEIGRYLLPNASVIPRPGFSSFITTGATTSALLATLAGNVASPQRYSLTAFNFIEELSLEWMREMFSLAAGMKGVYSSGGSTANLIALGAARQQAFEKLGTDPSRQGVNRTCRVYASEASHHTLHRAAAVLGMGRASVINIPVDRQGRMRVDALVAQIDRDRREQPDRLAVAIVANAGSTDTGAIDPIDDIAGMAGAQGIWLHIDGAYGLPGVLDPEKSNLYNGVHKADSVSIDPHKWLGAPVGTGATYVRDRSLLYRAFTQEAADYLEGSFSDGQARHSMDSLGIPYGDFGVELSAPSRGVVVWAIIREIGVEGLRDRICRHNGMAAHIARRVKSHPDLELALEPTLSICCFRYAPAHLKNPDEVNRRIHRQLVHNGRNIPSTTTLHGKLVIRPCFIGARTSWQQADDLLDEFLQIAKKLAPGPA